MRSAKYTNLLNARFIINGVPYGATLLGVGQPTNTVSDGVKCYRCLSALAGFAGLTATAGCSAIDQPGATDIILYSSETEPLTGSAVVTDTDAAESHTSRTLSVSQAKIGPVNRGKPPTNASYTIEVAVREGTSKTFDWTDPYLDLAPLHVLINDSQTIELLFNTG